MQGNKTNTALIDIVRSRPRKMVSPTGRLAQLLGRDEADIRNLRKADNIRPVYKMVDTCAAEFEAFTPYLYSTYERPFYQLEQAGKPAKPGKLRFESEANPTDRTKDRDPRAQGPTGSDRE